MTPSSATDLLRAAMGAYRRGDAAGAELLCGTLLRASPDHVGGLFLLAVLRMAAGDDDNAARLFQAVLALDPAIADAHGNLAAIRQRQGRRPEAASLYRRAVLLAPANPDWRIARAMLLPHPAQAVEEFRRALCQTPASAAVWRGLGLALRGSDPAGAARALDRAFRADPALELADSEGLGCRLLAADWRDHDHHRRRLEQRIDRGGTVLPLLTQLIGIDPVRQRRAAETIYRQQVGPDPAPMPPRGKRGDRLTVAYLSADFHEHATAYLIAGLFEAHDRRHFRVLAGCYGRDDDSPIRNRLRHAVDGFHMLTGLNAAQVADWAAATGVDILVDLKGYTAGARLDLLSRRLAPIQVAYLGYPGTMGGGALDYLIGDPIVTPAGDQPWYRERLAILPGCYQANDRRRPLPPAAPDRRSLGLPPTGFVFGALHGPQKLTPAMYACWLRLLHAVPDACLYLYDPLGAAAPNLRIAATDAGIDPSRLIFAGPVTLSSHLARYRAVDLCLDSFPYTGHTTTSDALWMGVPVITLLGEGFATRVAASLLHAVGLPELVTHDLAEYEALALSLARDRHRLAGLKDHLEAVRPTAVLFDTDRFTAHLEAAYRMMWDRHAAGLPPETLSVPMNA